MHGTSQRGIKMKTILFLVMIGVSFFAISKEVKKLHFNYNDKVTIWISNEACPLPQFSKQFPWKVDIMLGCFNGENNTVTIQWNGGDRSMFPADYFLYNKSSEASPKNSL
jgi:hypothetical protein